MRLLIVTDHRYFGTTQGIFDTYCFDRAFFDDYRAVFDDVQVMARVRREALPKGARRSDGDGVSFLPLPDWSGFRWMLGLSARCGSLIRGAVQDADAICVRLPSVSGEIAFRAARQLGKPLMFELIGDPKASLSAEQHGRVAALIGTWNATRVSAITRSAVCGSYVSRAHLQHYYPPGLHTTHESISSIRLDAEAILPPRHFAQMPQPLRLVLVASLVPVKAHDVLLRAVADAVLRGAEITLDLVGGGARLEELKTLAGELNLTAHVNFHGHIAGRENIERILDGADLFVMTSASEGMPRAMIEAMSRGLPAIGSAVGGITEILTEQQQFPAGDWRRLSEILASVDSEKLNRWAQHSEATACQFTREILSARRQKLLKVLREAAQSKP